MNKEKKLIPELRFPEFEKDGEWEKKVLSKITDSVFDGTHQTPTYVEDGIPFFSVENIVSGNKNKFISREDYKLATCKNKPEKGDILITRIGKIGFSAIVDWDYEFSIYVTLTCIKQSKKFNSYYLHCYFQSSTYQNEILSKSLLNAVPCKINMNELRETQVLLPQLKEQQKISSCLSSLDELITAHNEKLEALKGHKKGLMQNLFPQEGEKVPKFRFPEFEKDGEWVEKKLGDVYDFKVTNSFSREYLNYDNGKVKNIHYGDIHTKFNTLFDITKENVPFINQSVSIEKIKKESYCIEGDIIFADASEDLNDVGKSIEIVNLNNEKLVSGLHTLMARQRKNKIAIGFGGYLFKSDWIRKQIQREAQGAKVLGISASRISNVKIYYPKDSREQQKIALCLSALDELIMAQTDKTEQLQQHKKGLMQGLFPKNVNV